MKNLRTKYFINIAMAVAILACLFFTIYEKDTFSMLPPKVHFYAQIILIAVTLTGIYASLKWMKFGFIQKKIDSAQTEEQRTETIAKHLTLRMTIITDVLMFNGIAFCMFHNSNFLYLAIITAISYLFVYPKE